MSEPLLLASASPRRRQLLRQLGLDVEVEAVDIDENPRSGEPWREYVARMAREKAMAGSERFAGRIVLGADTVVVLDGRILAKPGSRREAREMLNSLSGREHQVATAVALVDTGGRLLEAMSVSRVRFTTLPAEFILHYVDTDDPLDKAGGYAIQGLPAAYIEHIEGSYSGIMGLPLQPVARMLARLKVLPWQRGR